MNRLVFATVILVFNCLFVTAHSTETHIVFDIEHTLVRGVPRWMAQNMDKSRLLSFQAKNRHSGEDGWQYHYYKRNFVEELVTYLVAQPNIKISFYSSDQIFIMEKILEGLQLLDGSGKTFKDIAHKLLYRKDTVDTWSGRDDIPDSYSPIDRWKKDLSKVNAELSRLIFITPIQNHTLPSQKSNVLFLGHDHFYAKSFGDALSNKNNNLTRIQNDPAFALNFPDTKEQWFNQHYKMAWIYLILKESIGNDDFFSSVKARLQEDRYFLTDISIQMLENRFKPQSYHWSISKGVINDCVLKDNRLNFVLKTKQAASDCLKDNESKLEWQMDHEQKQVRGCTLRDVKSGVSIEDRSIDDCLLVKKKQAFWVDPKRSNCSYFSASYYLIGQAPKKECADQFAFFNPLEDAYSTVEYFSGLEDLSVDEILDRMTLSVKSSIYHLNASSEKSAGIQYPRANRILYRGMHAGQMSFSKSLMAMMGDPYSCVESKIVTILKFYLRGQEPPISDDYSQINLRNLAQSILKKRAKPGNAEQALKMAVQELDKIIAQKPDSHLANELIDRNSGWFNEWGGLGLYTAPYFEVANFYGPNVIAFREGKSRGADLTWFHYKKYHNTSWPRVDNGEYVIPLLIPGKEIKGVHRRDSFTGYQHNGTGEAFYVYEYKKQRYILAIDYAGNSCVEWQENGDVHYCHSKYSTNPFPHFPVIKGKASVKAIISTCYNDQTCSVPSELFEKFTFTAGDISNISVKKITSTQWRDKSLKVFYKDQQLLPSQVVSSK